MSWKASGYIKEMTYAPSGKRLTIAEKFIALLLADSHQVKTKAAFPSLNTLAEEALMDKRRVRRILDSLEQSGVIQKFNPEDQCKGITNFYIFPGLEDDDAVGVPVGTGTPRSASSKSGTRGSTGGQSRGSTGGQNPIRNKEEQELELELEQETGVSPESLFEDQPAQVNQSTDHLVKRIWNYYLKTAKKSSLTSLTDKRLQMGQRRFEECLKKTGGDTSKAETLMQIAIDEIAASDFHMARGKYKGQPKYNDWENLFRSTEQLEKWLERSNG